MTTYIYAFASVLIVSVVSLVGVFTLSLKEELLRKYIFIFISLAIGALLGDAFIHLIPEALEVSLNATLTSRYNIRVVDTQLCNRAVTLDRTMDV